MLFEYPVREQTFTRSLLALVVVVAVIVVVVVGVQSVVLNYRTDASSLHWTMHQSYIHIFVVSYTYYIFRYVAGFVAWVIRDYCIRRYILVYLRLGKIPEHRPTLFKLKLLLMQFNLHFNFKKNFCFTV